MLNHSNYCQRIYQRYNHLLNIDFIKNCDQTSLENKESSQSDTTKIIKGHSIDEISTVSNDVVSLHNENITMDIIENNTQTTIESCDQNKSKCSSKNSRSSKKSSTNEKKVDILYE